MGLFLHRLIAAGLRFLLSVPHFCPPSTHPKPPPRFPTKDCFTLNFVRLNEISLIKSPPGWKPIHYHCHTLPPLSLTITPAHGVIVCRAILDK